MQGIERVYRRNERGGETNWSRLERDVRRLQGRIYRATRRGDNKGASNLMKLLVRSETAKRLAIYIITQRNEGRRTPGIDGKTYLTAEDRKQLHEENFNYKTYKFKPAIRRYIPKSKGNWRQRVHGRKRRPTGNAERRPLGVMTIRDRVMATIIAFALNAQWEARLEGNLMGFRPGRCTQDAIQKIYRELLGRDKIILDADINKFFDTIRHRIILDKVPEFREFLRRCFNAGIVEQGKKTKLERGILQGNPLSPLLANTALNGIQEAVGSKVQVTVYADDFIIIAPNAIELKRMIPRLGSFLKERGLSLKREKTRITTKKKGFNFLGFRMVQPSKKLKIIPQPEKVITFLDHVREVFWTHKSASQRKLITMLNPIIRGWAMYYRYSDATEAFNKVDHEITQIAWRWAVRRHNQKGKRWIFDKYFERTGGRKWTFRDEKTGYSLIRASEVVRLEYDFVVDDQSPLDPDPRVKKAWEKRAYQEIRHAMT